MKALALLSGGLDSTLAIRVVRDQGIEVEAISFITPFCLCGRKEGCGSAAKKAATGLGIKVTLFDIGTDFLERVKEPVHGYGRHLNPCIDCRILMHTKARVCMQEAGASFLITGEVLGQRPKSQHRAALRIIERESGLEGLILRPLSARLLPPSLPESLGWVDRDRLLGISGRSRKPQMRLAEDYGLADYPCPAGGCLLTDPGFSRRMLDLKTHSEITLEEIRLLKVGRHFRLMSRAKIVVGRDEKENASLSRLARAGDICFEPTEVPGPVAIGRGEFADCTVQAGAGIVARYSDGNADDPVTISVRELPSGTGQLVSTTPMDVGTLETLRI